MNLGWNLEFGENKRKRIFKRVVGEDERMWEGMLERMKERVCVCVGGRGGGDVGEGERGRRDAGVIERRCTL